MDINEQVKKLEEEIALVKAELSKSPKKDEINPLDLVGKLCYVWDYEDSKVMTKIVGVEPCSYLFEADDDFWLHAEPVSQEEMIAMTYKPKHTTMFDWDKILAEYPDATLAVMNRGDRNVYVSNYKDAIPDDNYGWEGDGTSTIIWEEIKDAILNKPTYPNSKEFKPSWYK